LWTIEVTGQQSFSVAAAQAKEAATFLTTEYAYAAGLMLGVRALLHEITWDNDLTDQA
jgi:hypothetical protein